MRNLRQGKRPTHTEKENVVEIDPDAIELNIPVKLGAQVNMNHLIKNDDAEEDDDMPVDTVAVVLLDRGTG